MAEQDVHPDENSAEDTPLLNAEEHAALRATQRLRDRSDRLIERSQRINRPKDFMHQFPSSPASDDPN